MQAKQVRDTFLQFFENKKHKIVPSAPMVLKDDPTLMFTNAGMNPFKDWFTGHEAPAYPRVADTQKCLRVSGKHNDLEEVGKDTYHHTMFEMLGNWSFGDYFKREAIDWAWELLTEVYQIPKEQLYATYFEGDASENLPEDSEAKAYWLEKLPAERVLPGNKKDNFWEMGDTGPCGPCSEIHVDIRPEMERQQSPGAALVNQDHPQVVEIWNLVFMQFNRLANGSLQPLPQTHVDTGMGLERLCMVLQGKSSNYDTDLFQPYIMALEKATGHRYGQSESTDIAMRVVADHLRAVALAITDGQLPSNTGAGYVIRRILRRAIRYGFSFLELKQPFIHQLVPLLVESLGAAFPDLKKQQTFVKEVIFEEETAFLRTLETGLSRLNELFATLPAGATVSGEKAFELYDTFGFPYDLTALIASEAGYGVDEAGFQQALAEQKTRSRAAGKVEAGDWIELLAATESRFVGYDATEWPNCRIVKYREVSQKGKKGIQLVLDQSPFYPEGGGQVGDQGVLISSKEQIQVLDTKRENNLLVHWTDRLPEFPEENFSAQVNKARRLDAARNHSATHLLHAALREILGTHVEQRGSLVHPDYLRFDFSHPGKIEPETLRAIEERVQEKILENHPLEEHRSIPFQEALDAGAMALFGEKYGDTVRMIVFEPGFSMELCGGTHVQSTAAIGLFRLVSEGSVAAGIRRIEAQTGRGAKAALQEIEAEWKAIGQTLKQPKTPLRAVEQLLEQQEQMKQQLESLQAQAAKEELKVWQSQASSLNGVRFMAAQTKLSPALVRDLMFELRKEAKQTVALIATNQEGKAGLTAFVSDDLVEQGRDARQLIKAVSSHIQGGGGGQAFLANAGGKRPEGIAEALEAAKAWVADRT